ncbi:MAG TPA: hypothetical protein VH333_03935 [Pseudonocardiaceae bacterium]|jgi:hypothetical protein|nr:hypothetical protein [Pseudonocardiaceae bacterium]
MGIRSKWRAGHMKDPVSGVFRVTDWYDAHPHSSPPGTRLTGVIVADGLPPTPAEAPADHKGRWAGRNELPVTVDRADPGNFRIEWDQVVQTDWRALAQQRALDEATKLAGGEAALGMPPDGTQTPFGTQQRFGTQQQFGGELGGAIEQALRSVGMDPTMLNSAHRTVRIETHMGGAGGGFVFNGAGGVSGQPATGVVRAVHDAASPAPLPAGVSLADLTIDVRRPDGSTYPVTTRIGFRSPARRAAIATVGTTLPLLVDSNNPGQVTIDVARLNLP